MRRNDWRFAGFFLLTVAALALWYHGSKIDTANKLEAEKHNPMYGKPATPQDVSRSEQLRDIALVDARNGLLVAIGAGLFGLGALIVSTTWVNPPPRKRRQKAAEAEQRSFDSD